MSPSQRISQMLEKDEDSSWAENLWVTCVKITIVLVPVVLPIAIAAITMLGVETVRNKDFREREYIEHRSEINERFHKLEGRQEKILDTVTRTDERLMSIQAELRQR